MVGWPHAWPAAFLWLLALRPWLAVAVQTIVSNLDAPQSLAIDQVERRIYWTEVGTKRIASALLDGSDLQLVWNSSDEVPSGVAIDSAARKVYWTTQCCAVRRANLNGTEVEYLAGSNYSGDIALDTDAGKMYWASWNGTIWRANLNGSAVEPLISDSSTAPASLALDYGREKPDHRGHVRHIYWTDNVKHSVSRANLDTGLEIRVMNISRIVQRANGIALDRKRGRLYVAGSLAQAGAGNGSDAPLGTGYIYRVMVESDETEQLVNDPTLQVPSGIVYDWDPKDPELGAVIWTDEQAGTIQHLDMRCAPGSLLLPSRTNASVGEVVYGPMKHRGEPRPADCPDGYTGSLTLVCFDGKVSVNSGQCSKSCPAGLFTALNGTNITHGELEDGERMEFKRGCMRDLVGTVGLACNDGTLRAVSGQCEVPDDCEAGDFHVLDNALIRHDVLKHGSKTIFDCPPGFNGTTKLGCRNGAVFPVSGICRPTCDSGTLWLKHDGDRLEVSHRQIVPDMLNSLVCPDGYAGRGIKLNCIANFIHIVSAQCTKTKRCDAGIMNVNSAAIAVPQTRDREKVTKRCPAGFAGSANFTCSDGTLEHSSGSCWQNCPATAVQDVNNVTVQANQTEHGKLARPSCPWGGVLPMRCHDGAFVNDCADPSACACIPKARQVPAGAAEQKNFVEVPIKLLLPVILVVFFMISALCFLRYSARCRKARSLTLPSRLVSAVSASTTPSSGSTLSATPPMPGHGRGRGGGRSGYLPERDGDMIADESGAQGETPSDGNEDFSHIIVPLPSYWATTDGIHITPDPNRINEVQQLMTETWRVCYTRDRLMIGGSIRVPVGCRVANVLRIENHRGYEKYYNHREQVAATRRDSLEPFDTITDRRLNLLDEASGEKYLFHGTNPESAHNIARKLFRIDMAGTARGCMFGPGIYLAENASKSDEYAKEGSGVYMGLAAMLICRAVAGKVNRVETSGDFSDTVKSGEYDSVCGDRLAAAGTFREHVLFHEEAVYPEFIVIYARVYDS